MPPNERGGLKAAFTNFNRPDTDKEAELKLLGRVIEDEPTLNRPNNSTSSYQVATSTPAGGTEWTNTEAAPPTGSRTSAFVPLSCIHSRRPQTKSSLQPIGTTGNHCRGHKARSARLA